MPRNPAQNESKEKAAKGSSWNLFSKSRRKSADLQPEITSSKSRDNLQPPPDSSYGSTGEQSNSLNSEANTSGQSSLNIPNNPSSQGRSLTPTNLPNDEIRTDSTLTHSNPTIRKETHHNPATGTTITTTVTTTTTTTIVAGPNGTTTIEEPRFELPSGRATPTPPQQSEAVVAAIQVNGFEGTQDSQDRLRNSVTPGQRPIPYRDPKSMSDLRRTVSREDQSTSLQPGETPAIPFRSSNRLSYQPPATPNGGGPVENGPMPSTSPSRISHNFSRPGRRQSQEGDMLPEALRAGARPAGPGSTLANLKTAAAGIHGAAETLRGTVSTTADRRLRASKATDAGFAKHQEIINAGKYEIESGKFAPRNPGHPSNTTNGKRANATIPSASTQRPPVPDSHPNALSDHRQPSTGQLRRQSWGNRVANQNPKQETGNGGRMAKWLHKASSHPSDKRDGAELRESTNF